jgi:23S rRNA (uracil1939-C5)-methyltransferase
MAPTDQDPRLPDAGGRRQEENCELEILRLVAGGDGLGFRDGAAVFVPEAAPGDRLRVRITERRRDYFRAEIVEILQPGPGRREPPCPVADRCGGCTLQHLELGAQTEARLGILRESFERHAGIRLPEPLELHASQEWGYRLRAELKVDAGRGKPRVGFLARRSHSVVPIRDCPVLRPSFRGLYGPLLKLINARSYLFRGLTSIGYLDGDEGALLSLNYNREPARRGPLFEALRWLTMEGGVAGSLVRSPRGVALNWGRRNLSLDLGGAVFELEPGCFVQTHRELAIRLWQRVGVYAAERAETAAFDLYAGSAFFSCALAPHFERVTAVESSRAACDSARRVLRLNRLDNVELVNAASEDYLERAGAELRGGFVVVDPPRRGLESRVRQCIQAAQPAAVLYLSCDAVTLARDARAFAEAGLRPTRVELFELFPHTAHFETLVLFAPEPS